METRFNVGASASKLQELTEKFRNRLFVTERYGICDIEIAVPVEKDADDIVEWCDERGIGCVMT